MPNPLTLFLIFLFLLFLFLAISLPFLFPSSDTTTSETLSFLPDDATMAEARSGNPTQRLPVVDLRPIHTGTLTLKPASMSNPMSIHFPEPIDLLHHTVFVDLSPRSRTLFGSNLVASVLPGKTTTEQALIQTDFYSWPMATHTVQHQDWFEGISHYNCNIVDQQIVFVTAIHNVVSCRIFEDESFTGSPSISKEFIEDGRILDIQSSHLDNGGINLLFVRDATPSCSVHVFNSKSRGWRTTQHKFFGASVQAVTIVSTGSSFTAGGIIRNRLQLYSSYVETVVTEKHVQLLPILDLVSLSTGTDRIRGDRYRLHVILWAYWNVDLSEHNC